MAARDDSVIRGSLIASLILLVLSLALNFFLWSWGDTQATEAARKQDSLQNAQAQVRTQGDQLQLLKAMLGVGQLTDAQFEQLKTSVGDDADINAIEQRFAQDMTLLGDEVDPQNRNYPALPEFFATIIRSRNDQYNQAREEAVQAVQQRDADVANARREKELAEESKSQLNETLDEATAQFTEDREAMKAQTGKLQDEVVNITRQAAEERAAAQQDLAARTQENERLQSTIDTQKRTINELRQDEFEVAQGEITNVLRGGKLVQINLGSADALRPGVIFSVLDAQATRISDADTKAQIEVISVRRDHLSICKVVSAPALSDPIIEGDQIYSPFWAPGRRVRIALAGVIDIDGDGKDDSQKVRGMIQMAGAEIAATITPSGARQGELDSGIRFLVVGETPELDDPEGAGQNARQGVAEIGKVKSEARELGITILPAWKLVNYLQTISDTVTTPLGSAVRGEDFAPQAPPGANGRLPSDVSGLYEAE